jgi:heme oxygenase (biliverdin-IX-beta and delta-forming)
VKSDVFDLLKEGTADVHQQIEERVPVFREGFNLADYAHLVERFYGYWFPVETKLIEVPQLNHPELHLLARLKSRLLIEDLKILGRDPASLPLCNRLPVLDTYPRALGCLYVLEGSTLGGRLISKRLAEHLNLHEDSGAAFFNAYGESTGRRWLEFKSFVSTHTEPQQTGDIVTAARQTFQCFYDWLGNAA